MKTFKNRFALFIFSAFFIGISMISCSPSDDSPIDDTTAGSILGRWALDKRNYMSNGVITPVQDYENNQPGCNLNDYFEFKDNGIMEIGYYDPNCAVTPGVGNWSKTDNLITLTHPFEEDLILELLNLTATEMKVRANLTGREGTTPGLEVYIYYVMVKVN